MDIKKIVSTAVSSFLAFTIAITASAYTSSTGSTSSYIVNNKTYRGYSETRGYSSSVIGVCCVDPSSGSFKGGEVGGRPTLYNSSGSIQSLGDWSYCPSNCLHFEKGVTSYANSGSYYTRSSVSIWVDANSSYTNRVTTKTPNVTVG